MTHSDVERILEELRTTLQEVTERTQDIMHTLEEIEYGDSATDEQIAIFDDGDTADLLVDLEIAQHRFDEPIRMLSGTL